MNVPNTLHPKLASYWCHTCREEFSPKESLMNSGVACPKCNGDFCEEIVPNEDNPKEFVPYESNENTRTNSQTTQPSTSTSTHRHPHVHARQSGNNPMNQVYVFSSMGNYNGGGNMIGQMLSNIFSNSVPNIFQQANEEHSLEQIIQHLMEHDHNQYGPPPASKQVIDQLPMKKITKDIVSKEGAQECSVCKEEFKEEEDVKEMPCKHLFHNDCLLPWLKQHNSCPTCRFELQTDDLDYENRKQIQQTRMNPRR